MITVIIFTIMIIISIILFIINRKKDSAGLFVTATIYLITGIVFSLICSMNIVRVKYYEDVDYQTTYSKRQVLENLYNESDDITIKHIALSKIIEFNKYLYRQKKLADNPFTNVFINQKIANDIDYIEVNEKKIK